MKSAYSEKQKQNNRKEKPHLRVLFGWVHRRLSLHVRQRVRFVTFGFVHLIDPIVTTCAVQMWADVPMFVLTLRYSFPRLSPSFVHMQTPHVWIMHTRKAINVVYAGRRKKASCRVCVPDGLTTCPDRTFPSPVPAKKVTRQNGKEEMTGCTISQIIRKIPPTHIQSIIMR